MRIAVVTTSYPAFDGDAAGHFVETEASRMATTHRVTVVTAWPAHAHTHLHTQAHAQERPGTHARPEVLRLAGGDAFGFPGMPARLRGRGLRAVDVARWAIRARAALAALAPLDRVVAHWAVPCAFPVSTGARAPVEVVSHGGDVRALVALPGPLRGAIVRRILRDADAWRFVSARLEESLAASLDPRTARLLARVSRVEPCAIDMPDVTALVSEKRAQYRGGRLAVCVARLVPSKRVDLVIDHMAASSPTQGRLVVVGDGPLRAELAARARALGVDALFVGQTPRPVALAWIGAADVVLHASEAEGLSTVAREAEALRVPLRFVGRSAGVPARRDLR